MGDRIPISSSEYTLRKRSSLLVTQSQKELRSTVKKRVSAPPATSALVREYFSQYGDLGEGSIPPPPGYERLSVMDRSKGVEGYDSLAEEDVIEKLASLCRSQAGSRQAQSVIAHASPSDFERILDSMSPHLPLLMVDNYANYTCQTLFLACTPMQRISLLRQMQMHLGRIARDGRGTHALQKLIALVNVREEEDILVAAFLPEIIETALHPNASHALQKLISSVQSNSPLILPISQHLESLCTHQLGLLIVKTSISCAKLKDAEVLRNNLLGQCVGLMQDPFGNYAIQHMLETWGWAPCRGILGLVQGKVPQLSMQKFASNTVERLLELAASQDLPVLLAELADPIKLREMMGNKFAQFVLKKAIALGGEAFKCSLRSAISTFPPHLPVQKCEKWNPILSLL